MTAESESQDAINEREWSSSWNWSRSGFYSSKADNRLWVPKRPGTGIGQALNVGHPGAKVTIAGLLITPAAFVLLLVLLSIFSD